MRAPRWKGRSKRPADFRTMTNGIGIGCSRSEILHHCSEDVASVNAAVSHHGVSFCGGEGSTDAEQCRRNSRATRDEQCRVSVRAKNVKGGSRVVFQGFGTGRAIETERHIGRHLPKIEKLAFTLGSLREIYGVRRGCFYRVLRRKVTRLLENFNEVRSASRFFPSIFNRP